MTAYIYTPVVAGSAGLSGLDEVPINATQRYAMRDNFTALLLDGHFSPVHTQHFVHVEPEAGIVLLAYYVRLPLLARDSFEEVVGQTMKE